MQAMSIVFWTIYVKRYSILYKIERILGELVIWITFGLFFLLIKICSNLLESLARKIDDVLLLIHPVDRADQFLSELIVWKRQHLTVTQLIDSINSCFGVIVLLFTFFGTLFWTLRMNSFLLPGMVEAVSNPWYPTFYAHWLLVLNDLLLFVMPSLIGGQLLSMVISSNVTFYFILISTFMNEILLQREKIKHRLCHLNCSLSNRHIQYAVIKLNHHFAILKLNKINYLLSVGTNSKGNGNSRASII